MATLFSTGKRNDTWEWDGTAWIESNTNYAEGARAFPNGFPTLNAQDMQIGFASGLVESLGTGIRFTGTSSTGSGNKYMYWGVGSMSYVVKAGDVVEYDVYFDTGLASTAGLGGIELKNSDGTYWRDAASWADQNGVSGHPSTDLTAYASGKWYHRKLPVPPSMVGKTIVQWDVVDENDSPSYAAPVYYDGFVVSTPAMAPAVTAPTERMGAAMVTDTTRGTVLLFGGYENPQSVHDTWEWNGLKWIDRHPATSPPGGSGRAMAYDAGRDRAVLFGGSTNETWEWNGTTWTRLFPTNPPPARDGPAMAYDAARHRVVMFGGYSTSMLNETWEWNGTTWTHVVPATSPPGRQNPGMAYDAVRQRVVLFGGWSASGAYNDTWEWDGTNWTQRTSAVAPSQRGDFAMAYHAARGRVVLFGGYEDANEEIDDTWEWDGTTWTQIFTETPPEARSGHALAYDAARGEVIAFGGYTLLNGRANDTWIFRYDSTLHEETCLGFDSDGDGQSGCADDDCAGFCTPLCPPGTSCDPTLPRCGDGTCQPIENCRLCPADCGTCSLVCGDLFCDPGETATSCPGDC